MIPIEVPKAPEYSAKPVIEVRERLERRINRDFNDAADDNFNVGYNRWRTGIEFMKDKKTFVRVTYQFYWDINKRQNAGQTFTDRYDLFEGFVQDSIGPVDFKLGRQEVNKGDRRVLGNNDWGQGQTWDGLRATYGKFDFFGGQLGPRGRPNSQTRMAFASYQNPLGESTVIYMNNGDPKDSDRIWTLDHYWTGKKGKWDFMLEGMIQGGRTGAKELGAFAGIARARYQVNPKLTLQAEIDVASGGDSATHTSLYNPMFPSVHGTYGVMDMQSLRNTKAFNLGLSYQANRDLNFKLDYWKFFLYNDTDGWYGSSNSLNNRVGGTFIDKTGKNGSDVGDEIDFYGTWKVGKTQEFLAGASVFLPGNFIKAFNPGTSTNQYWVYAQWQIKF